LQNFAAAIAVHRKHTAPGLVGFIEKYVLPAFALASGAL
jgi:hypothetical protein